MHIIVPFVIMETLVVSLLPELRTSKISVFADFEAYPYLYFVVSSKSLIFIIHFTNPSGHML